MKDNFVTSGRTSKTAVHLSCHLSFLEIARMRTRLLSLLFACLPALALADNAKRPAPPPDPTADPLMIAAGFLSGHPDLRYRLLGLKEFKAGRQEDAFRFFQRAAYYADKPSQGMVAEMLWDGRGTPQNRALAYVWMDLAAERGYAGFLGLRELYWNALSEAERERAIQEGQTIYAKYGDAAAQPRIDAVLRRERRRVTGSRTGFAGNLQIYVPGPGGYEQIDGSKFHDPRYWDPKQYRAWHDAIWAKPRVGRAVVGDLIQVQADKTPSRVPQRLPQQDAEEPQTPVRDETGLGSKPVP